MATESSSALVPRTSMYETDENLVLSVFVKDMKPEHLTIEFGPRSLSFKYCPPEGDRYELSACNLTGTIVPAACRYQLRPMKAEITMRKSGNFRWQKLEGGCLVPSSVSVPATTLTPEMATTVKPPVFSAQRKDGAWQKQIKEVEKEEEKDWGPEGLFRSIYGKADENTRRAMLKSYHESNGTVLSCDWSEVGHKKVECQPPDDQEFRPWN